MNSTTTLTITVSPSLALPKANPFAYIDFVSRSYGCLVHLLYFLFVLLKAKSELRTRTFLFLHNINLSTFTIAILYVIYIPARSPSFNNPLLDDILCTITELIWSCLKYSRVLSLLLLAFYRYTACLNVQLYKRINSRLSYMYGLILSCWLASILIPLIFKFSLNTTFSAYYCLDGYAPDRMNISIVYYVVNTVLSSLVPTVVIVVLYVKIFEKLKDQSTRTSGQSAKLAKFAKQFIVINILTAVSSVLTTFVEFVSVIAVREIFYTILFIN